MKIVTVPAEYTEMPIHSYIETKNIFAKYSKIEKLNFPRTSWHFSWSQMQLLAPSPELPSLPVPISKYYATTFPPNNVNETSTSYPTRYIQGSILPKLYWTIVNWKRAANHMISFLREWMQKAASPTILPLQTASFCRINWMHSCGAHPISAHNLSVPSSYAKAMNIHTIRRWRCFIPYLPFLVLQYGLFPTLPEWYPLAVTLCWSRLTNSQALKLR